MKTTCLLFSLTGLLLAAGPVDFGRAELQRAIHDRGIGNILLEEAIEPGAPESYAITARKITGADPRGLMYGLLAVAEQIRTEGLFTPQQAAPKTPIRGIRYFLHNEDLERDWYYSHEYWDEYLSMLARNRFNRFNLVFAHQTDYLAPPYPFWMDLPEFPTIRARNLSAAQRERNLEMLRYISQGAAGRGIDFTLGVWEHDIQHQRIPPMKPMTEGLTRENIGPYSYAALKKVLQLCPAIRSVQMRTNSESGIPNDQQVDFYKNYVFRAIHDAGRPVLLDLRGWVVAGGMVKAAEEIGVPVRLSTKYWAEDLGRPYQPAETFPNYSYLNFLEKPRRYGFYWELWGLGSNRLLLWGNPEYVRRAVSTFGLGGAEGFEIDPPLAQKGFGNAPGKWGVFTEAQKDRVFWKWEFERYWLFYRLWGRLSFDPATPERTWMDDLKHRFGPAAADVMDAYTNASQVVNEIVAVHLADPNMYIWPEINPGGLTDAYREVLPSDWRYVASIPEAVRNRLEGIPSAKQTAPETAARFDQMARRTEEAVARAGKKIGARNHEWLSSEPDFLTLAAMARYHAHKQRGTYLLAYFDRTGDAEALASAKRELEAGLAVWERLVKITDVYPGRMSFGPDDVGHWRDKLPYVRHDLALIAEREDTLRRFGKFDAAFDFGGPVQKQTRYGAYRADDYVLRNTVAPRFTAVDPKTRYAAETGFGWLADGDREAVAIPLTPYLEVRAAAKNPQNLPHDLLFRDYIHGRGAQAFGVKAEPGKYEVQLLHPDRTVDELKLPAENGMITIPFPAGEWSVSGIVVKGPKMGQANALPPVEWGTRLPPVDGVTRPSMRHEPASTVPAGKPVSLQLAVSGSSHVRLVRLYYRPVNQLAEFKMLEAPPGSGFTIPGNDVSARWDLMYYFEVLNDHNGGWFEPDPLLETPYHVIKVVPGS
jgi:hypothetical protein